MRLSWLLVCALAIGCGQSTTLELSPSSVRQSESAQTVFVLTGYEPQQVLEHSRGELRAVSDLKVQVGPIYGEIVEVSADELSFRLATQLQLGSHPVALRARGESIAADRPLVVFTQPAGGAGGAWSDASASAGSSGFAGIDGGGVAGSPSGGSAGVAAGGAGGSDAGGGTSGAGGVVAIAGAGGTGGVVATGGATGTGGVVATGGATGTGGVVATGGTGGVVATGGAAGTGGVVTTGGATGTGGVVTTGGATGTGGVVTTGGAGGTGGVVATGGVSGAGGTGGIATGGTGNVATGGTGGVKGCDPVAKLEPGIIKAVTDPKHPLATNVAQRWAKYSCANRLQAGYDAAWMVFPPKSGVYTFNLGALSADCDLYVITASCDGTCVTPLSRSESKGTQSESVSVKLQAGTPVYVVVDSAAGVSCLFTLESSVN